MSKTPVRRNANIPIMPYRRRSISIPQKKEEPADSTSPLTPKMTLSVDELKLELGVSRTVAYNLVQQPGFPSFSIGKRILISREGLSKWIERQYKTQNVEEPQVLEK